MTNLFLSGFLYNLGFNHSVKKKNLKQNAETYPYLDGECKLYSLGFNYSAK